ncbi:hypothetical protein [Curtobacterium phage Parvaparticeps]|nr:hypothetical protein [Curtobacterium phage Parvaparticeps]
MRRVPEISGVARRADWSPWNDHPNTTNTQRNENEMPRLQDNMANAVENTEATHGGDFEPLPAGKYLARLAKVEERNTRAGAPAWNAEFEEIHRLEDLEKQPGRQWLNLNLPQGKKMPQSYTKGQEKWDQYQNLSKGRLAAFFEAFGFTADSDTDEMIGEWAVIVLTITTIQQGPKAGQRTNSVQDIQLVPEDVEIPEVGSQGTWTDGGAGADEEDAF